MLDAVPLDVNLRDLVGQPRLLVSLLALREESLLKQLAATMQVCARVLLRYVHGLRR